jgi:hypothetical protein
MLKIYLSRGMAAAVLSAVLTVGSLSLAATPASACGGSPHCGGGPPPVAAPASCTNPDCINGVPPAAASPQICANPDCASGTPPVARMSSLECSEPTCLSGTQPAAAPWPGARPAVNCPPPTIVARSSSGNPGC